MKLRRFLALAAAAAAPVLLFGVPAGAADRTPVGVQADEHLSAGTVSDLDGLFEPGESVEIDPSWHNELLTSLDASGTASLFDGPGSASGISYDIVHSHADYGTIPGSGTADCHSATAECYVLQILLNAHPRPAAHWDATVHETLGTGETEDWVLHVGDSFADVPRSQTFYRTIETIFHYQVTVGCGGGDFCPTGNTLRGEMSAFIARVMAGGENNVPDSGSGYQCDPNQPSPVSQFSDVPPGSTFCKYANYLKDANVTVGCGGGLFCVNDATLRGEMAIFIARAFEYQDGHTADPDGAVPTSGTDGGSRTYDCVSGPGPFPDVPAGSVFCKYAGFLWTEHVIDGFPNGTFGGSLTVRRDETSKFLANGFGLALYGP
jgi:hypothetical protein